MNSAESFREQVERLIRMEHDDGDSWDLTQNDQAAINAVLQRMAVLDEQVARLRAALTQAGEVIHSELCTREHHEHCIAVDRALSAVMD